MSLRATEVIHAIESSIAASELQYQSIKVQSNLVSLIRSYIRCIYSELYTANENHLWLDKLRLALLKLQTSPVLLTTQLIDDYGLGDIEIVKKVWGADFSETYQSLSAAIILLNENESPLMIELVKSVSESIELYGIDRIRIWAHRNETSDYMDKFHSQGIFLSESNFIYSLPEYRKSNSFDVLYRMGPLRSEGWSKIPKVIISAPHYKKLIQIMWSGSFNESDFGMDPVIKSVDYFDNFITIEKSSLYDVNVDFLYDSEYVDDADDLVFLSERVVKGIEKVPCILIEFLGEKGALVTPRSQQLIFNREDTDLPFSYKSANVIESDNTIIFHDVKADLGFNSSSAEHGMLAPLWKSALKQMYKTNYRYLMYKMGEAGIDLLDLDRAAKDWFKVVEGEVIHGPQSKEHFKALVKSVLPGCLGDVGWVQAWKEIQASRVEAIQYGRIESAIVNEELVSFLEAKVDSLSSPLKLGGGVSMVVEEDGLSGIVTFHLVIDTITGFLAPQEVIGNISDIDNFEKFRIVV
jgi:hypothetical protein